MSSPTASNYVLGQSVHEYERLMLQARILRPYTEKFFRAAGLAPGMRVLDIGSGMGDVALLSADIVGPGGIGPGLIGSPFHLHLRRRTLPHMPLADIYDDARDRCVEAYLTPVATIGASRKVRRRGCDDGAPGRVKKSPGGRRATRHWRRIFGHSTKRRSITITVGR